MADGDKFLVVEITQVESFLHLFLRYLEQSKEKKGKE